MGNRGRHRKQIKHLQICIGLELDHFKYTLQGRKYLKNININKLYRIYTNKNNEVWRIEEDIERKKIIKYM